jgi:futalosine hydrolase
MNLLVVAATASEIAPFLAYYRKNKSLNIDVLITGIGLTATATHLTRQFCLKRPPLVIQAGLAGSFSNNIPPGSVVAVKKDTIADQSVVEKNRLLDIFDLEFAQRDQFPYRKGWLENRSTVLKNSGLQTVTAVSINQISTSPEMIGMYRKKYKPAIESMEGAALHYSCLMHDIPFLQLRGVSNHIGERNKTNWQLKKTIANLNRELIRLINEL